MRIGGRTEVGNAGIAIVAAEGAARREGAAGRKSGKARNDAGNGRELAALESGRGGEEPLSIRMAGRAKDFGGEAELDEAAGVHDSDAIGDASDNAEIVSNEEKAEAHFAAKAIEKFEDLLLDGDVERRGGLVSDEERGIGAEGHGDHDALAKAAGKLMGKLLGAKFGFRDGGALESGENAGVDGGGREGGFVGADGFGDLRANAENGIEGGHGLLKDHGDAAAANGAPGGFAAIGEMEGSGIGEMQGSGAGDASAERKKTHEGEGEHGLAAAGFADEAEGFAGSDFEGDGIDGANAAGGRRKFDGEIAEVEERGHGIMIGEMGGGGEKRVWRLRAEKRGEPRGKARG